MATYFYQTNLGEIKPGPATCVIVSSIHFGWKLVRSKYRTTTDMTTAPYIHLNNWAPSDPRYNKLWTTLKTLKQKGTDVAFMLGGAGGAFNQLFSNFDEFSALLTAFIRAYNVDHLVLDVEEHITLGKMQFLVVFLKRNFPTIKLSLAPVLSELTNPTTPGAFSGFCYQKLWDTVGTMFHRVYVQMYGGAFTVDNFEALSRIFTLDPTMLVPGFQSGDYPDPTSFSRAMAELTKMKVWSDEAGFQLGGCFVWEYFDAPPDGQKNPTEWAAQVANILDSQ